MTLNMDSHFYQVEGGALPLDAPTYVSRSADEQLYQFCISEQITGRVCSVLAPRQTGKSSLMVRTAHRLILEGFHCVQINLQVLGEVDSEEALLLNLLILICQSLDTLDNSLKSKLNSHWTNDSKVQSTLKFKLFLTQNILSKVEKKLIIFLDEIQTLISWNLQNSFFGFIKTLLDNPDDRNLNKLSFVLLGVAKPSELITSSSYGINIGHEIEIGRLQRENSKNLQRGLEKASKNSEELLDLIIGWTGGHPFLTQLGCYLVVKNLKNANSSSLAARVEEVFNERMIEDWRRRRQDKQSHFAGINDWFGRVKNHQKREKLTALNIYEKMLHHNVPLFDSTRPEHWDLIISGLAIREDNRLQVANRIYEQVFNEAWVDRTKELLWRDGIEDALTRIYNRDVFILIDQSGSMVKTDGGDKSRWELLCELVMGDGYTILSQEANGKIICDQILVSTFNINKYRGNIRPVNSAGQIEDIFLENRPNANTFVTPNLKECRRIWLNGREKVTAQDVQAGNMKGVFFIIYTDGSFDDTSGFENFVRETCSIIDDERIAKVLVVGIGKDIDEAYFREIDRRLTGCQDINGKDCSIVVFEMSDSLAEVGGILELMQRELYSKKN